MQSFFEKLGARVTASNSLLCVGLDPRARDASDAREQCVRLIDATLEYAAAFKVNSAFFEVFGGEGFDALREVIAHVPREIPVILDAKRGDIADTSVMYARAAFETLGAEAITVSPYVGGDGLAPFYEEAARGAFVLCKTSNAGADEFQALETNQGALFEMVARRAQAWNTRDNVGLVVGATDPARLKRVRELVPEMWFLVPGIGKQGGDLEATLRAGLRADGMGLLINASRSLAEASSPRAVAQELRDEINRYRAAAMARLASGYSEQESDALRELANDLLISHCVRFGEFTLKSGQISPIYLDLRRLVSYPTILRRVAQAYAEVLRGLEFERIVGIPYAALPIATAVSMELNKPLLYPRREVKGYGTKAAIEGEYAAGERVVVVDDLATTGETKFEAIEKLAQAGLRVRDIVVLIDRGQGAADLLGRAGYQLHAVTSLPGLLEVWRESDSITTEQYDAVREFLRGK